MPVDLTVDAAKFLTDFGETITYRPDGGKPRRITAIVERQDAEAEPAAGRTRQPGISIVVQNDCLAGISADEIDIGTDKVELALRVGGEQAQRALGEIISQDEGILTLRVR